MIKQTTQQFYRENNDFCIAAGQHNCVYLIMKDDTKINDCDHVAVKLDLSDGTVNKFSRDHDDEISSFLYNSDRNILITGGYDESICLYNCAKMKLIKRVIVDQGSIHSLLLKSNMLYIGAEGVMSVYLFHNNNNNMSNYQKAVSDISLVCHIQVAPRTEEEVYLKTFTECGEFDFWFTADNSKKIYRVLADKQNNRDILYQLGCYTVTATIDETSTTPTTPTTSELQDLTKQVTHINFQEPNTYSNCRTIKIRIGRVKERCK
jgi:WD40 repeat protein